MNDAALEALTRTVNNLAARLAAAEAQLSNVGQTVWQLAQSSGGGSSGQDIQFASGAVPAKGTAGAGILGSATLTLSSLDASTGLLVAGPSQVVWNNGVNPTANDLAIGTDASGNKIVIAEFCP